jgi:Na+/melibiose symporter-like transporter
MTLGTGASAAQTKWALLAYGGMSMPLWLAVIPILTYLPAFYAQELHLRVGLVGLIFLSARLWDGCADLLVGWLSDRSMSRFGRRWPWVLLAAPCLMVATWFLCNPPQGAGLLYLAVWAALFYTAWTAMYIPYLSWGSELATDYVERSRVTSFREAFTMLGNLFFALAPLVLLAPGAPLRDVLFLIAIAVLLTVPLAILPLGLFVRDPVPTRRIEASLAKGLTRLAKDRILVLFIIATLLIFTGEGVINSVVVFAFDVGLQMPGKVFWIIFIIYVAALTALPAALRLNKRTEKHKLLAGALAVKAIGFAAHLWVPMGKFPVVIPLWIMVGIAHIFTLVLPTSILADIIDHGEVSEGERRSGAYVAIYNLALKVGLALGVGLSFGLLGLLHFDPSSAHHSAADALNVRLVGFALPGLLIAVAIVLLLKHPITKAAQQRLREIIDSRSVAAPVS